jgi:hypothetical protein
MKKFNILLLQIVSNIDNYWEEEIMLIESTIYINKSVLEMLYKGSEKIGRSKTSIIKLLMQRVMRENQRLLQSYSRVKYQERDIKENWHRFHIVLNEYEYEYYLDMRKFFKMSVSFILAFAVRSYLNDIVNELINGNKNTDNYLYRNYIFVKKTINEVICWKTYWGIPRKLPLY